MCRAAGRRMWISRVRAVLGERELAGCSGYTFTWPAVWVGDEVFGRDAVLVRVCLVAGVWFDGESVDRD